MLQIKIPDGFELNTKLGTNGILGGGSQGCVICATKKSSGKDYALKLIEDI